MRDGEMHIMSVLGAILLTGGLVVPTVLLPNKRADAAPPLEDMQVIEASLAYRAPTDKPKPKQPQKVVTETVPAAKVEGVSRDENKQVDEKKDEKKDPPPKKDDVVDPLKKYARPSDPDNEPGTTRPDLAPDGSEFGRGNITKGDPYFQRLWADLDWSVPELARTGGAATLLCIKMNADGTVAKTFFKQKGDDDVATLADKAADDLKTKRNQAPLEIPAYLLNLLTTKGICFNLTAS